ncbi:hypothetical protein ACFSQ0_10880 [Mesonia sediminis]|uniref:SGNH/GDSL hydrolase family protein n=1 Tax=Mesonia sediminis TaxID=1703946 RepID=A0ABW5SG78_9FLAO
MNSSSLKHIIKIIILILIISFVVDKLVFYGLNKISDKVYTGQSIGKLNQYLQIKDDLEFFVFGSSRANHNIDPIKVSEHSFNMGMDGRKLAYSATLIKLLPNEKKQTILLHIDPENAFNKNYSGDDILALSSKYNRNSLIKQEIDKLKHDNLLQNFYWSLSYNNKVIGILKNYLKPKYNYKTYSGYDPIYVNENQREIFQNILEKDEKETSEKEIDCQKELVLNEIYYAYINELSEFCKENNKTLIIFTSPVFDDGCSDDNIELNKILKKKNLDYYDFTNFFKENNNLEYWKDKTHLSNKGAEIFSEKIKSIFDKNR